MARESMNPFTGVNNSGHLTAYDKPQSGQSTRGGINALPP
jgi:hypothetical protein